MGCLTGHASGAPTCEEAQTRRAWVHDQCNNSPARASSRVLTDSFHCAHRSCQHIKAPLPQPGGRLALRAIAAMPKRSFASSEAARSSSKQRDGRSDFTARTLMRVCTARLGALKKDHEVCQEEILVEVRNI